MRRRRAGRDIQAKALLLQRIHLSTPLNSQIEIAGNQRTKSAVNLM
jgi:hypothetical protein